MNLRFARRRIVWPGWIEPDYQTSWPRGLVVDGRDAAQLAAILRLFGAAGTDDELRTRSRAELLVGGLSGFDEVPIEAWDVVEEPERVLYQLWTYYADGGVLFAAGTTQRLAPIAQSCFLGADGGVFDVEEARALAFALDAAKQAVRREHPGCDLAGVEFVRS